MLKVKWGVYPPVICFSLWNEYDRGYLITHLLVEVEVTFPKLWVLPLSSSQIEKYNYIKEKRDEGYYYYQISDMMNESNFKPQRTDIFTPQQVWGLEFKLSILRLYQLV